MTDPATAAGRGSPSCRDQASCTLCSKAEKEEDVGMLLVLLLEDGLEAEEGEGLAAGAVVVEEEDKDEDRLGLPGTAPTEFFFQKDEVVEVEVVVEEEELAFSYFLDCIPGRRGESGKVGDEEEEGGARDLCGRRGKEKSELHCLFEENHTNNILLKFN